MTEENVVKLPEPGVVLDLDAEERDPRDIKPPFRSVIGGKTLTFADPMDIDWRDLAAVEAPAQMVRLALSPEDADHISRQGLPTWKFNRLMEAYYKHYNLEEKIREARRQSQFR